MIQLQFRHLRYDIEQQTNALAEARILNNPELKAEAQIDDSAHLSDIAMRFCESGCALLNTWLKDKLVPISIASASESSSDDESGDNSESESSEPSSGEEDTIETDELTYDDKVWNFNTTLEAPDEHTLATLFHRFVVAYVLWQWAKLFAPNEADALHKQMLDVQKEIETIIYELGTPIKRRPFCFDLQAPEIEVNWTT